MSSFEPSRDKQKLRRQLQAERQTLIDRHQRAMHLQEVLRVWLMGRSDHLIGAYWPIKGEFDTLPALFRWTEADPKRQTGLPVIDKTTKQLRFHLWYPGCEMEEDAFGIPKPKDTPVFQPQVTASAQRLPVPDRPFLYPPVSSPKHIRRRPLLEHLRPGPPHRR